MKKKTFFGILLSLALVLGMMSALGLTAYADEETGYGVWIGETQITSANLSGKGWSYDVDSKTLTLDSFKQRIKGHRVGTGDDEVSAVIYSENDLAINFKDNNTVRNTDTLDQGDVCDIYSKGTLTIDGDGILNLQEPDSEYNYSILVEGDDLVVNNGTINAFGGCGVYAKHYFTINGGTLNVNSDVTGIYVLYDDFIINGGTVICDGIEKEGISVEYGKLEINGGSVKATSQNRDSINANYFGMNGGHLEVITHGGENKCGIYAENGNVEINDSTINALGCYGIVAEGGDFFVNGSKITVDSDCAGIYIISGDLIIKDAEVNSSSEDYGIFLNAGDVTTNNSKLIVNGNTNDGLYQNGFLEINDSYVKISSDEDRAICTENFEMNGGYLEVIGCDNNYGIHVFEGNAVINDGTVRVSGGCGINAGYRIYFNGGDVTASGKYQGVYAGRKVILSDKATVMAGDDEESAEDVTSTFVKDHAQNWVHVSVTPDPEPAPTPAPTPGDPTAPGTVHEAQNGAGTYVVTSADSVSIVKAPNKKSYTLPATVTISGKVFNVTGIQAGAFKGTNCRTLTVKTKGLTKASVKDSLKGSKVRTVKVKVGKKKDNKKYVKKYKKIFTKKNAGRKVKVS